MVSNLKNMQSDTQPLREWGRQVKIHKSIPAPSHLRVDSLYTPFVVQIINLEGQNINQHEIRYSVTLLHRKTNAFFGRTFRFGDEKVAYVYTNIKEDDVVGICEVMQVDMAGEVLKNRRVLGWCLLYCFQERQGATAQLHKGSVSLLSHTTQATPISGMRVVYEVRIHEPLNRVYPLLPPNTFIGPHEMLPGVSGEQLPADTNLQIQLLPFTNIFIKEISIGPIADLEQRVIQFANRWRRENYMTGDDNQRVDITGRRLLVGVHNSWQFIGGQGPEAAVPLRIGTSGMLEGNMANVRDAVRNPLCALVFELEYALTVPRKRGEGSEHMNIIVAWTPMNFEVVGEHSTLMLTGPGQSVSGKMLWQPPTAIELNLQCHLSYEDVPVPVRTHVISQPAPLQTGPDINQLKAQLRAEIETEYERKFRQTQEALEQERRRNNLETFPPAQRTYSPSRETGIQTQIEEVPVLQPVSYQPPPPQPVQQVSQQIDYSYLDSIQPVPILQPTQEKAFAADPNFLPRDLSRTDKARLVRAGVRGLLDYEEIPGVVRPRLDVEAQDPLKGSVFFLQFLAIRPTSHIRKIPSRVCFGLRFYTYSHHITDTATIAQGELNTPQVILRDGSDPELVCKYEIEPAEFDELDFARYLLKRRLTVEVWDSDSLILIGSCRVPLIDLLRQGRPHVTTTKEYVIIEEMGSQVVGSLQLMLRNMGRAPSVSTLRMGQYPLKLTGGTAEHKRKVRSKQIELDERNPPLPITTEEQKKRIRVLEWKKQQRQYIGSENWDKTKKLKEVGIVREGKKPIVLKEALRNYISTAQKIYARMGQAFTFQYTLRNPYPKQECFTIVFNDEELKVVTNIQEWQWWVSHQSFDRPNEWDMLGEDKTVILNAGESVPILFKYVSAEPHEKIIQVWVHQSNGASLVGMELEVIPWQTPVDHVFRFYEPENRIVKLALPTLHSEEPGPNIILQTTLKHAIVNWETATDVSIEIKTAPAPQVTSFYVFAYTDPYECNAKAIWEIKLHSLIGVDVTTTMGQATAIRLPCPGDLARTVRAFSSHPDCVVFPPPHNEAFTLIPKTVNSIPAVIRVDSAEIRRIRVNLVDVYHKALVYSWILRVESQPSTITQIYEIPCQVGVPNDKRVQFANRSQSWALFLFRSSHPNVLQVKEPRLALEGGARGFLWVHIPPAKGPGTSEVCVFANDSEENIFECILFKLNFR